MISSAGPTILSTAFISGRKKYNKARDNYYLWNFYGGGLLITDSQKDVWIKKLMSEWLENSLACQNGWFEKPWWM